MPPTIATRPGKLDWLAYPSQERTLVLSGWTAGYIDGRSYELRIRGLDPVVGTLDTGADTVTFVVTMPDSGGKRKLTIVDTFVDPEDVIIRGEVFVSDAAAGGSDSTTEVTVVTVDEVTVELTVTVMAGGGGGGGSGAVDSVNNVAPVGGNVTLEAENIPYDQPDEILVDVDDVQAMLDHLFSVASSTEAALGVLDDDFDNHAADTTGVHGIADTSLLETTAGATAKVAAEATLARNGDNITGGTVADARIASTIARDSEVTAAVAAEAALARNADNLTGGTVADARIASTIARDSEVASAIATSESGQVRDGDAAGGDLTGTYPSPTIANDAITNAKAANMAESTIKGRAASAGTGDPTDLTPAQVLTVLGVLAAVEGARMDLTPSGGNLTFAVDLTEGQSGGDSLVGGTDSLNNLELQSTSHATRGRILVRDFINLATEDKNSIAGTVMKLIEVESTRTLTFDETALDTGNSVSAFNFAPTLVFANTTLVPGTLFNNGAIIKNNAAAARVLGSFATFNAIPTIQGDGALLTAGHIAVNDSPTVSIINGGTTSATLTGLSSAATINTGATVATRTSVSITDAAGAGTLTTQVGIDIAALAKGTTNVGIRNASTTVKTPIANTSITATSATIRHDASIVTLTANNSYTLASTPTISDGQNGEELLIINVDTADTITIQDQGTLASSNLRLSATTIALGPRDSIRLVYNSTVGDWVQVGQTNVV